MIDLSTVIPIFLQDWECCRNSASSLLRRLRGCQPGPARGFNQHFMSKDRKQSLKPGLGNNEVEFSSHGDTTWMGQHPARLSPQGQKKEREELLPKMQRKRGNFPTGSVALFPPGAPRWAAASPQRATQVHKSAALAKP